MTVLNAHTGQIVWRRRSIGANWRVKDFVSVLGPDGDVDDSLEKEFGQREQAFLNVIREIQLHKPVTAPQKAALDDLAAIHLVRNLSFAAAHDGVVHATMDRVWSRLARDEQTVARFTRQWGRPPEPGELDSIIGALGGGIATSPDLFASGARRVSAAIQQLLGKWTVQLVGCVEDLPGFLLPDNPVLHGKRSEGRFGFRNAGAIGDADMIVVPIRRRLVAFYSAKHLGDKELVTKKGVRWVNSLLLQSAQSEVACHPADAQETSRLIRNRDRYPAEQFDAITLR